MLKVLNFRKLLGIFIIFLGVLILIYSYFSYDLLRVNENRKLDLFFNKEFKLNVSQSVLKNDYIAVLEIPKIKLKKGLNSPYSKLNTVSKNIEILEPIEMPDMENSTFILASHSGTSSVSYFNDLYKLEINDLVYVYYKEQKYIYKIVNKYETNKNGFLDVRRNSNGKIIVLTTCNIYKKSKQLVVIGNIVGN